MDKPRPEDFGIDLSKMSPGGAFLWWFEGRPETNDIIKLKKHIEEIESDAAFAERDPKTNNPGFFSALFTAALFGFFGSALIWTLFGLRDKDFLPLYFLVGGAIFLWLMNYAEKELERKKTLVQETLKKHNFNDLPIDQARVRLRARVTFEKTKHLPYLEALHKYYEAVDRKGATWWTQRSGRELEVALADLFSSFGYEVALTKGSGDGGVDVIVETSSRTYLIQSKGWQSRVGVPTVRELAGVVAHTPHREPVGVVLATGGFTAEAEKFASDAGVLLWGPDMLTQIAKGTLKLK